MTTLPWIIGLLGLMVTAIVMMLLNGERIKQLLSQKNHTAAFF